MLVFYLFILGVAILKHFVCYKITAKCSNVLRYAYYKNNTYSVDVSTETPTTVMYQQQPLPTMSVYQHV